MASVFTQIIKGEAPARFIWKDGVAVAFLTINPITPGHVLVVPRKEIDHWEQMDTATFTHLSDVAQKVGRAVKVAYNAERIGLIISGLEIPHVHLHVLPVSSPESFDFTKADPNPDPKELDAAAKRMRNSLRASGYLEYVPNEPV